MADTVHSRLTMEEFLSWEARQEGRHEFVGGLIRAMVGATRTHGRLAGRVFALLQARLASGQCEAFVADMKVVTARDTARYPDIVVDCAFGDPHDLVAARPTVVVEILSRSTSALDENDKLEEYQSVPSMRHILHLRKDAVRGAMWSRLDDGGWRREPLIGGAAEAVLPAVGVRFALSEIYDGVPLEAVSANEA